MKMIQYQRMRQTQQCRVCKGTMDEHNRPCPVAEMREASATYPSYMCPVCYKGLVTLNTQDFFQCRKCNSVFTSGEGFGNGQFHYLDTTLVQLVDNPDEYRGEFRIDIIVNRCLAQINALKAGGDTMVDTSGRGCGGIEP